MPKIEEETKRPAPKKSYTTVKMDMERKEERNRKRRVKIRLPRQQKRMNPPTSNGVERRTPDQRKLDEAELLKCLRRGFTKDQIAEKLKLSIRVVEADYCKVMRLLSEMAQNNAKQVKTRLLQEYAEVKREAWEGWERSKNPRQKKVTEREMSNDPYTQDQNDNTDIESLKPKKGRGKQSKKDKPLARVPTLEEFLQSEKIGMYKITTTEEGQSGDPRFLSVVERVLKEECELEGVYPEKKDMKVVFDWDKITADAEEAIESRKKQKERETTPKLVQAKVLDHREKEVASKKEVEERNDLVETDKKYVFNQETQAFEELLPSPKPEKKSKSPPKSKPKKERPPLPDWDKE